MHFRALAREADMAKSLNVLGHPKAEADKISVAGSVSDVTPLHR